MSITSYFVAVTIYGINCRNSTLDSDVRNDISRSVFFFIL
jgi:hypothetical protein